MATDYVSASQVRAASPQLAPLIQCCDVMIVKGIVDL
jgi:hypothetical protein